MKHRLHFTGIRFHCRRHLSYIHRLFLQTDSENRIISKSLYWHRIFCVFETKNGEYGNKDSYSFLLKDVKNNKELEFQNEELGRFGIDKIVPLSGNLCGIKIGNKTIGVINVNQFVSDMVIGLEKITYTDILDNASDTMQLAHMRKYNNTLLYTKRDVSADSEEVVIYDYDNKVKRVRLNSRISEAADFKNICVISGVPYNFLESDKGTRIINLNTQKTEYKLPADVCVEYVQDDIIVTSEHVKRCLYSGKKMILWRYSDFRICIMRYIKQETNLKGA